MKNLLKIVTFSMLVLFYSFHGGAEDARLFSSPESASVNGKGVIVRNGPNIKEKIVCRIAESGTDVRALGWYEDWIKIRIGSCTGWIKERYLNLDEDIISKIEEQKRLNVVAVQEKNEVKEKALNKQQSKQEEQKRESVTAVKQETEQVVPVQQKKYVKTQEKEKASQTEEETSQAKEEAAQTEETSQAKEEVAQTEKEESQSEEAVGEETEEEGTSETEGIFVKNIIFQGNTVINTETLQKVAEPYRNKALALEDMSELTDQITMTYQEKGYILARAYLPEQELSGGILKIAVAEGHIGKIKVAGRTHFSNRVIKRYFKRQEKLGVIKEALLEKGLLLSSKTPQVKTNVVLKKGDKPDQVDVVLNTKDTSVLTFGLKLGVDFNNYDSNKVGKYRSGTRIDIVDHYFGTRTNIMLNTSNVFTDSLDELQDKLMGSFTFTIPMGGYGTEVALKYLEGSNALNPEVDKGQGFRGRTRILGGEISQPIITKKNMNLSANIGYSNRFQRNVSNLGTQSVDELDRFHLILNFDNLDRFLGKNIVTFSAYYGRLVNENKFSDELKYPFSRPAADRDFQHYSLNVARVQKVYGYTNFMLRAFGQMSDHRLVDMEQMGLTGYGNVRGYDSSLFSGDKGFTMTGELMFAPPYLGDKIVFGQRLSQLIQFSVFMDYGAVFQNDAERNNEPKSEYLSSYGASVSLYYKNLFRFRYDFAKPMKDIDGEPNQYNYFQISFDFL